MTHTWNLNLFMFLIEKKQTNRSHPFMVFYVECLALTSGWQSPTAVSSQLFQKSVTEFLDQNLDFHMQDIDGV
jgi:hypothetical protein